MSAVYEDLPVEISEMTDSEFAEFWKRAKKDHKDQEGAKA